jgi:small subunit ribosomal protein S4e
MVKNHIKSLNTPKTWNVARKGTIFTTRPNPGAHSFNLGISLNHVIKRELGLANTTKEVKLILNNGDCLVNNKEAKDVHLNVGFMDIVSFPKIKKYYRITINKTGKLFLLEINEKESLLKLSKITNKTVLKKGKVQLNTMDGKNILIDKDSYNTSSSLLIDLSKSEIKKSLNLEKNAIVILIGGRHIGSIGMIESVSSNSIIFRDNIEDKEYETLKKFVFVIGKDKSEIMVE